MLIPYSTDAPIYHWPAATVGLIVAVFSGVMMGGLGPVENWILWYGQGLRPDQWLRSIFMHAGIGHLIGNMLFLWVFGLVVEGKIGWWKFLCCYLAMGLLQSALEQLLMLGYSGDTPGSLGASAAIFGLMAMATVWAPANGISFLWLLLMRTGTFDVSIAVLSAVYAGLEIVSLLLSGGTAGSSWLHLGGMALGFPLAIVMLKRGLVDCEGWDLFHYLRGEYGAFKKEPDAAEVKEISDTLAARQQQRDKRTLADAKSQFDVYLRQGNVAAALLLFRKMAPIGGGLVLNRAELLTIVNALHADHTWADSAPYMAELIARFPEKADPVRLKLAQICVVALQRPGRAMELLAEIDPTTLTPEQNTLAKRIAAKARQLQEEGTVELDTDAW